MMNSPSKTSVTAYVIGIAGAFLIMLFLVRAMQHYLKPAPPNQARAEQRRKEWTNLKAANVNVLQGPVGWQDQAKKIVRLPIDRAMELTVQEYKNPRLMRSNLIDRVDKATFVPPPPPKAPEKPSVYE